MGIASMRATTIVACLALACAVTAVPINNGHVDMHEMDMHYLGEGNGMMPGEASVLGEDAFNPSDAVHNQDMQAGSLATAGAIQPAFDGTGRHDRGPSIHNMAGAPYGLPGYKESHDWVNDIDIFSPIVFDWHFYGASLDTPTTNEIESKTAWEAYLAQDQASAGYPNCAVGNPDFDVNQYMQNNQLTTNSCGQAVKEYLTTGMYEGKHAYNGIQYFNADGKEAFSVSSRQSLYPQNTYYPSTTFTWSMWAKHSGPTSSWQELINVRKKQNDGFHHDYNIISGGASSNQVVMVYMNPGNPFNWMACSPWDNSRSDYNNIATTFRGTGATPGYENDNQASWFQRPTWYHVVHTFAAVGSAYDSTLYLNGKKCVSMQGNDMPYIVNPSKYNLGSGTCTGQGGTVDCGGPWIAEGAWSYDKMAELARVRYFPEEALNDDKVQALYLSDKTSLPCLDGDGSCL